MNPGSVQEPTGIRKGKETGPGWKKHNGWASGPCTDFEEG